MDKMSLLKDKILQEILDDMDEHESMRLMPKGKPNMVAVVAKGHMEPDGDEIPYGNKMKEPHSPEEEAMEDGSMDSIRSSMEGGKEEDDEDDLHALLNEYSRL